MTDTNLLNVLLSDIKLYNSLPNEHKHLVIASKAECYKKYNGLIDLFNLLTEKNVTELTLAIKDKLKDNYTHKEIIDYYDEHFTSLVTYILDHLTDNNSDIPNLILSSDKDDDIIKEFIWNKNQIAGWQNAINTKFASGIHSQATGTGKSLMALKIIWEYHKLNPKNNIMWLCERKDIPQKLFFNIIDDKPILHIENMTFWKKNDIIDMSQFIIKEYIYRKNDNKWMDKLTTYKGDKPLFIIINRAYLTTKSSNILYTYKYEQLKNNIPKFIILDECHSAMATETYKLLLFMKWNWKANIQGLSATPYRKGKSYTSINIDINCPDKDKINTQDNQNKLINIFHKQGNVNELNVLSWFNLKEAIENNIILEPIFHWFHIKKYIKKNKNHTEIHKKYSNDEIISVLTVLNDIIEQCKYKKCVVWCRLTEIADDWFKIFTKEKHKYSNLNKLDPFINHSQLDNKKNPDLVDKTYEKFYLKTDNALMFSACQFREGSDIPYLSCCMFLDKVKDRGDLPFIQSIGRVLRKDDEKLKENGHIIDGCTDNDEDKMKGILNKLLRYYLQLYEIVKSDFELISAQETVIQSSVNITQPQDEIPHLPKEGIKQLKELSENKLNIYDKIIKSLRLAPEEKKIYIDLDNDKRITLNLDNVDIKTMEWNKLMPNFDKILKNTLVMCDYEEYIILKKRVKLLQIKNVYEYDANWQKYRLYTLNDKHEIIKIEPKLRFNTYFKNWYDFLDRDTSKFIKNKSKWQQKCLQLNITKDNYLDKIKSYDDLPDMPHEFYRDFTNLTNELKQHNNHNTLL